MQTDKTAFLLDFSLGKKSVHQVTVVDKITVGSHEQCDVCIKEQGLAPQQCLFRSHNGILSICNLGEDKSVSLENQGLLHGKMYVIEPGDKLKIGKLGITITQSNADHEDKEAPAKPSSDWDDDVTDIMHQTPGSEQDQQSQKNDEHTKPSMTLSIGKILKDVFQKKAQEKKTKDERNAKTSKELAGQDIKPLKAEIDRKAKNKKDGQTKSRFSFRFNRFANKDYSDQYRPGVLVRIPCLGLNLLLAFTLYQVVLPTFELELVPLLTPYAQLIMVEASQQLIHIPSEVSKLLGNAISLVINLMGLGWSLPVFFLNLLNFSLFYLLFNTLSHLLLATSLPLWLLTITDDGQFVLKRLRAIFRCILGFVLAPFMIFDLPLMLGLRSFKEVITRTHLHYRLRWARWLFLPFTGTALIALCLAGPLLQLSSQELEVALPAPIPERPRPGMRRKPAPEGQAFIAASKSLQLQIEAKLPAHWVLIPGLKSVPRRSPKEPVSYIPELIVLDTKNNQKITLSAEPALDFSGLYQSLFFKFPPLSLHYPALGTYADTNKLSKDFDEDLARFQVWSLALSLPQLQWLLRDNGPFIASFVNQKKQLLAPYNRNKSYQLKLIAPGRIPVLKISPANADQAAAGPQEQLFIALGLLRPNPLKLSFVPSSQELAQNFEEQWLETAKPIPPGQNFNFDGVKDWNDLSTLDFMTAWAQQPGQFNGSAHWEKAKKSYKALALLALQNKPSPLLMELKIKAQEFQQMATLLEDLVVQKFWEQYHKALVTEDRKLIPN